jgi:hypothetical protein
VILTEHQLELFRALQFHSGSQIVRSLTEKAAYGKLADAGVSRGASRADLART